MRVLHIFVAVAAIALAAASVAAQRPESFTIRALIVDTTGKPIRGEIVHCLVYQDGRSYAQQAFGAGY